jgi:DNA repair exonuclease SbcCD ATPase subunit
MADLKLKKASIRNWMKFRNVELEFPDRGLVMVIGQNNASNGALQSVGSGKTGIGEAISRTLMGVQGRFQYVKSYSTDKKGDTYVRVEALLYDQPLVVEMGYKCKEMSTTGEALRFHYDGKTIERGLIAETRAELTKLIGVPPLLASWTVLVDGENLKFNKLGQGESVELVMSALRQPPWSEYHEHSKRVLGRFNQELAKDEKSHDEAQRRAQNAKLDCEDAKEAVSRERKDFEKRKGENQRLITEQEKGIATKHDSIKRAKTQQEQITKKLQEIEQQKSTDYHTLEIERNDMSERIRLLENKRTALLDKREETLETHLEAKRTFETYEISGKAKNCPTCGTAITKAIDPTKLDGLRQKAAVAAQAYSKAKTAYDTNEQQIKELTGKHTVIVENISKLSVEKEVEKLSTTYEELEDSVVALLREVHQMELKLAQLGAGVSDSTLKTAEATLAERERVKSLDEDKVNTTATALAASRATVRVIDYWNHAFSPYGIPNMVLKESIAPLNREARRVSSMMTGGTIEITYNTRRELANGKEKAELVIEVDNKLGSTELAGNSKGESGLTNLIIAETLSEVGQVARRIGYRWYDEVVPHQDQVVCRSIYSHLRQVAHDLGILIFIVDHNPVAADYADHVLLVEKNGAKPNVIGTAKWK